MIQPPLHTPQQGNLLLKGFVCPAQPLKPFNPHAESDAGHKVKKIIYLQVNIYKRCLLQGPGATQGLKEGDWLEACQRKVNDLEQMSLTVLGEVEVWSMGWDPAGDQLKLRNPKVYVQQGAGRQAGVGGVGSSAKRSCHSLKIQKMSCSSGNSPK